MTRDPLVAEFLALADCAVARASVVWEGAIRRAALSAVRNSDVRSEARRRRDARIAAFRSGWVAQLGEADGALATVCAWPGTEGARRV